jgi:hypothetical protein
VDGKKVFSPRVGKSAGVEQKSFGGCAHPKSPWQHAARASISSPSMTPESISLFNNASVERLLKALKEEKTAKKMRSLRGSNPQPLP